MSGISYDIISYDPEKLGLIEITRKVLSEFLDLVGVDASIQDIECREYDELVSEWARLGTYHDGAFSARLGCLYSKARSRLQPSNRHRGLLVTSTNIGQIVGVSNTIGIISYSEIAEYGLETFATAVFHELGHMHGAPSRKRHQVDRQVNCDSQIVGLEKEYGGTNAIYECLGKHCLNVGCSMRQRLDFAHWKLHLTQERLKIGRPYCDRCLADLKDFCQQEGLLGADSER